MPAEPWARLGCREAARLVALTGMRLLSEAEFEWVARITGNGDALEAHRVTADSEGRLVYAQSGEVVDTPDHPAIYVMDTDGNVYVHPDPKFGEVHHSTIAGGEPVASAGEIQVINGKVTDIDDQSGHYGGNLQPNSPEVAKQELGQQGVDVSDTQAHNYQGG